MSFSAEQRVQYEAFDAAGHTANKAGDFVEGERQFGHAYRLAVDYNDPLKRLDALNPLAKALWSQGRYSEATARLNEAITTARQHEWLDEAAIADSNHGRLQAVKALAETDNLTDLAYVLRHEAVPHFSSAYGRLRDHSHLYYRFANAQHGVGIAALAGDRRLAHNLFRDGMRVSPQRSPEPYDQVRTYRVNPKGLAQMALGATLIPLGVHTPGAEQLAHQLIR